MKKNSVFILFLFIYVSVFSQSSSSYVKNDSIERLIKISDSLRYKNDMYQALEYGFRAVNYAHNLQSNHYISHSYLVIGVIQYEILDYDEAKRHLLKSVEYAEKSDEKKLLPYIFNTLGSTHYDDQNDYENALIYYQKAVAQAKERKIDENYQIFLHNLIWVYMDLDQFDVAAGYLKEADSIDALDILQIDRSTYYLQKARNYAHYNEIEKAEHYFEKSFELLEKETFWPKGKSYFYKYKSEMYESIDEYPKALANMKKLQENDLKVFENARKKSDEITKIRFKVDQYEQELEAAKREKVLLLDIDKNNKTIIVISIASLILLIGIVFFYYRGYRSKKKINAILESKNLELQLAKSQAEKLSKIKSKFISTISHELRTPLYGVVGISSLLLEDKSPKSDRKLLESLKFSADYLLNLVNKVLKISKIDAEKTELIKTPTNLFDLSNNILQSLEPQAEKKGNSLALEYDHRIPNHVEIDNLCISEVLINLIGNAIKFTEKGTITLRVTLLSIDSKIANIGYEIEDTGIGIPEDQKEYIFEEFSQVGSIYENKQGTGLGLSIVKNLLEMMESTIHFDSIKNIGSKFYFNVDLEISETLYDTDGDVAEQDVNDAISANILIAEDNKINQMVSEKLLKSIGCDCTMVENGAEAVKILKKETFDLVLMDINMPVMDGVKATRKIRKFDKTTPIIALTASELNEVKTDCLKAGMNDLLNKPLNKGDLRASILKNINSKSHL